MLFADRSERRLADFGVGTRQRMGRIVLSPSPQLKRMRSALVLRPNAVPRPAVLQDQRNRFGEADQDRGPDRQRKHSITHAVATLGTGAGQCRGPGRASQVPPAQDASDLVGLRTFCAYGYYGCRSLDQSV